jgi:hypothetical protein
MTANYTINNHKRIKFLLHYKQLCSKGYSTAFGISHSIMFSSTTAKIVRQPVEEGGRWLGKGKRDFSQKQGWKWNLHY